MQGVATKNTYNTKHSIFSTNQTKTLAVHVNRADDKNTTIAAIFKHSKSTDYDEVKLNPLQKKYHGNPRSYSRA